MLETTLIIVTRNEISGLKKLIRSIPFEKVDEYFAVDFHSTDGTVEFFKRHEIPVVQQIKPGRAEAFRIGARHARGKYLLFFSPDGNENPADIPILIHTIRQGYDAVIASRFKKGARNEEDDQILKLRAWANRAFTFIVKIIWGGLVTDAINGYRIIKKDEFEKLTLDAQGYAIEYQMTIRLLKLRAKIAEIPTTEGERIGGKSGSYAFPTGIKFLYYLFREIFLGTRFLA